MEIKNLRNTDFDTIANAFKKAFKNYDIQITKEQLQNMLIRRGFVPELSFAAFEGDKIVAFTINGIGNFNGKKTAYDIGTGTVEEYQGRGLASKIFKHSIPFLKANNIPQYLLEVLQHNSKAVSVYNKQGFKVSREFRVFVQKNSEIKTETKSPELQCEIKPLQLKKLESVSDFWDFYPSWQNSFESINRKPDDFKIFGTFHQQKLIGYCIFAPYSGDLTQIAVAKQYRRKGVGSLLFAEVIKHNQKDVIKILNTDVKCQSITAFLKAKGIDENCRQFEMIREIK